ncbi:hypothetical protein BSKO_13078 [Bryopsis sp. KO-2023]|nr:hypothetical protein BSKO_13078 [Bryopsis sp. KO-2023]
MLRCLLVVLAVVRWSFVSGSPGDRSSHYRRCVLRCSQSGCARIWLSETSKNSTGVGKSFDVCEFPQACPQFTSTPVPAELALTRWSCEDDCRYHCMMAMEEFRKKTSHGPVKYHGKWPFKRVYGTQEIFSSMLSVLNFLAHVHNAIALRSKISITRKQKKVIYPYSRLWWAYVATHLNAWFWSTMFHARDVGGTEKADYFSASWTVFVGLYVALARCGELRSVAKWMVLITLMAFYLRLVYYLNIIHFDYGYNMAVCIVLGIAQGLIWIGWAWRTRHPSRRTVWLFFLGLYGSMLAEVFDFPPFGLLVDAHAVWHAATIPLTYVWYKFIFDDIRWWSESVPMEKGV